MANPNPESVNFWFKDRDFIVRFIDTFLKKDYDSSIKTDLLLMRQLLLNTKNHQGYINLIAKHERTLSSLLACSAVINTPPNVAPTYSAGVRKTHNPWQFNYTRWYTDAIYFREQEYTSHFYPKSDVRTFLTNCGMSAFGLAIEAIHNSIRQVNKSPYFLLDNNLYGECQHFITGRYGERCSEYINFKQVLRQVNNVLKDGNMPVVILDLTDQERTMRNAQQLRKLAQKKIVLLLDITRYPDYLNNINDHINDNWMLVRFESLTKYYFAGLGTGRAGAVTFSRTNIDNLFDPVTKYGGEKLLTYKRALLGGSLEPYQAAMIPPFSLSYQRNRINKHYENAAYMSSIFKQGIERKTYGSYDPVADSFVQDLVVQGQCIFLSMNKAIDYHFVADRSVTQLERSGITIKERASFGFNYATLDIWSTKAIRVSSGCEDKETVEKIATVLSNNLTRLG